MNPMLIGMLAGAAMGFLKNKGDERNYKQEQETNVIKSRYSPWTGHQASNPKNPDAMGSMMQGAMAGASMGQQFGGSDSAPIGQQQNMYSDNKSNPSQGMGGYRQPINRNQQNFYGNQGTQYGRV